MEEGEAADTVPFSRSLLGGYEMSETRDRAESNLEDAVQNYGYSLTLELLLCYVPELAVVDRKAKLPACEPISAITLPPHQAYTAGYALCQQDMRDEGWVKEIRDG